MKTRIVTLVLACGSAAWLASSTLAGPPPQVWNRPASATPPQAKVTAEAPAALPKITCAMCATQPVTEFVPTIAGKPAPHTMRVGTQHTCSGCSGAVTEIRGKVQDTMVRTACATAGMKCCL